jgi:hypothetical protein
MQSTVDHCLEEICLYDKHYLVRSRHHAKVGIDPQHIAMGKTNAEQGGFAKYAYACGVELARAHCRSDHSSNDFEKAMLDSLNKGTLSLIQSAQAYSKQVCEDWKWLLSVLKK